MSQHIRRDTTVERIPAPVVGAAERARREQELLQRRDELERAQRLAPEAQQEAGARPPPL